MPRPRIHPATRVSAVNELVRNGQMVWRLLRDSRVSNVNKLLIPAAIAYLISPIDLIPDMLAGFFGLGIVDDLAVVVLAVRLFLALAPKQAVDDHLAAIEGGSIDDYLKANFRVVEQ